VSYCHNIPTWVTVYGSYCHNIPTWVTVYGSWARLD
jgi:CRISPR/Cas system CMR-associated protein Cmr5 small subunit